MNCPNCKKELDDGTMFCPACGQFIDHADQAEPPGKKHNAADEADRLLHVTEQSILKFEEPPQEPEVPAKKRMSARAKQARKKRKSLLSKKMMIAAASVLAVLTVVLGIALPGGRQGGGVQALLYFKDNSVVFADSENVSAVPLPENLLRPGGDALATLAVSGNEKFLFYGTENNQLYYAKVGANESPVLVDSGVSAYSVNRGGSQVVYEKDGKIYLYDMKETVPLASNVYVWMVNEDITAFLYWDYNESLYLQELNSKSQPRVIDSGVFEVLSISDDLNYILYIKGTSLMLKAGKSEPVKVASDVAEVFAPGKGGGCYYLAPSADTVKLKDFVTDDLAVADSQLTQPKEADYQKQESYADIWGQQQTRTVTDHEAYNVAVSKYEAKVARDAIRATLDETLSVANGTLYYFNGSKSVPAATGVSGVTLGRAAKDGMQAVVYTKQARSTEQKVNIANVANAAELKTKVQETLNGLTQYFVSINGKESLITEEQNASHFEIASGADSAVLYMTGFDYETNSGTLKSAQIKGSKLAERARVADAVYSYSLLEGGAGFVYFKSVSSSVGELYLGDKRLASSVSVSSIRPFGESGAFGFLADYSAQRDAGILYFYNGKKLSKVDEGVSEAALIAKDEKAFYYFKDYRAGEGRGDLCVAKSGKPANIAYDVQGIALVGQSAKLS
ncbi:MAG: zinc ribbon domain-containing protein [Oscillospiraceae bacterium]|nr:zinc ribbon domain-containing protein [Oscillospiraceae bacterium]